MAKWTGLGGWNSAEGVTYGSATAKKLGTGFMVKNENWEPQRVNNFELVIEGLNKITLANGDVFHCGDAGDRIMLSVQNFTAPSLEIARITTQYANNSVKWAGKPEFPDSSVTVNDYIGVQVERILSAWFRAAYDFDSEKIGLAKNYKKTAHLIEYDPQGGQPRIWKMEGCWLANFNLGEWNQDGNQQRQIQATFIYDRVYPVQFLTSSSDTNAGITVKSSNDTYTTGYTGSIGGDTYEEVTAGTDETP